MQLYWVLYSTSFVPTYRSFPIEKARKVFFSRFSSSSFYFFFNFFIIIIQIGFGQYPNLTRSGSGEYPAQFSLPMRDRVIPRTIGSSTHYPSGFWPSLLLPSQRTCILSSFSLIKPVKEKEENRENGLYIWVKIVVNE